MINASQYLKESLVLETLYLGCNPIGEAGVETLTNALVFCHYYWILCGPVVLFSGIFINRQSHVQTNQTIAPNTCQARVELLMIFDLHP